MDFEVSEYGKFNYDDKDGKKWMDLWNILERDLRVFLNIICEVKGVLLNLYWFCGVIECYLILLDISFFNN